ncbi:MAG: hypothetical protein K5857_04345 [Lachnospiraceae bacterium]|nr:hypothetical protein [Lachnospiraceae bacterium]
MTAQQKKARRRMKRNLKRTAYSILTAPVKMHRLSRAEFRGLTRACEICGVLLVILLLVCMIHAGPFIRAISIICAVLFAVSIIVIQLQMFQDELEERGFKIQGKAF